MTRKRTRPKYQDKESRKQARLEHFGTNEPICGVCGEIDDRAIDEHHLAGQAQDPFVVLICATDHRKLTDMQKDHPKMPDNMDILDAKIANFMLGLADLLRLVAEKLQEFAQMLIERVPAPAAEGAK